MADNVVQYIINITGNAAQSVNEISQSVQQSTSHISNFTANIQNIRDVGLAFEAVNNATSKLTNFLSSAKAAYLEESVETTKLTQLMKNATGATDEQIQSVLNLTAAQQKLGVVGDETQIAGARQLSMYVKNADSINTLLPLLNDTIVAEKGLSATQGDAATVADMLGKALNGTTMMLERSGFILTEEQKALMRTGSEQQRVAVLSEVLADKVGGVNKALAATPEGAMKNAENNMGDLQERIGKLWLEIQGKFMPVIEKLMQVGESVIGFIERNSEVFTALAIVIGTVILAVKGWIIVQGILNVVMALNPAGLIVIAIIALIAVIVYLCVKIKGWGTLWDAAVSFMKNITLAFVESIKLYFSTLVNGIMIAIDKIKLGWYKFKEAVGMGDSDENHRMIAQISGDVEARKKAIVDGAKKVAEYGQKAKDSFKGVSLSWDSSASLKGTTDKLKAQLGLGINDQTQQTIVNNDLSKDMKKTGDTISSGGQRNTSVNITIGNMVEEMNFNGTVSENARDIENRITEIMSRVLGMAALT